MSEEPTTETDAPEQQSQEDAGGESETFDADYVAKLRKEAAKYRTEAKANADAARKLAEIEEANKSEVDKAAERAVAAEERATTAEAELMRLRIAVDHGIESRYMKFLTGNDEDELVEKAKELAELQEQTTGPRPPKPDPNQGRQSGGTSTPADQFAAAFQGRI